jgi:hypothetical protein
MQVGAIYMHDQEDTELKGFSLLVELAYDSNQDSSVSTLNGYGFDDSSLIAGRDGYFSSLQ